MTSKILIDADYKERGPRAVKAAGPNKLIASKCLALTVTAPYGRSSERSPRWGCATGAFTACVPWRALRVADTPAVGAALLGLEVLGSRGGRRRDDGRMGDGRDRRRSRGGGAHGERDHVRRSGDVGVDGPPTARVGPGHGAAEARVLVGRIGINVRGRGDGGRHEVRTGRTVRDRVHHLPENDHRHEGDEHRAQHPDGTPHGTSLWELCVSRRNVIRLHTR